MPSQRSTDPPSALNEVAPLERKNPEPIAGSSNEDAERTTQKRPASSLPRKAIQKIDRISSESESSDSDTEDNLKHSAEGFDYKQWEDLNVSSDIKELFQYIPRFGFVFGINVAATGRFTHSIPNSAGTRLLRSTSFTRCNHSYRILYQPLAISMPF